MPARHEWNLRSRFVTATRTCCDWEASRFTGFLCNGSWSEFHLPFVGVPELHPLNQRTKMSGPMQARQHVIPNHPSKTANLNGGTRRSDRRWLFTFILPQPLRSPLSCDAPQVLA